MNAYQQGFNEKCAEYNINPQELIKSGISLMQISKAINKWALGLNDVKGFGKTMTVKPTKRPLIPAQAQLGKRTDGYVVGSQASPSHY